MPKFNPDFWEIPVPPEYFDQFTTEDYFWYRAPDDEYAEARRAKRQVVLKQIRWIIAKELTKRQAECIQLYFYKGKTQGGDWEHSRYFSPCCKPTSFWCYARREADRRRD